MRLMQVRGLLAGQGWYDLTPVSAEPAGGLQHPLVAASSTCRSPALILLFKPFVGTAWAERLACGIAPMLPLSDRRWAALAFTVRRLIAPAAYALAIIILLGATAAMLMFMPMRIDHHGWQLAMLEPDGRRAGRSRGARAAG